MNLISQAISVYDRGLKLVHTNRRLQILFQQPDELVQPGADFDNKMHYIAEQGDCEQLDDIDRFVDEMVTLAWGLEHHYFERTQANSTSISQQLINRRMRVLAFLMRCWAMH